MATKKFVLGFDKVSSKDTNQVGGKNAALGKMIRMLQKQGVRVPDGFATMPDAFRLYIDSILINPDRFIETKKNVASAEQ